MPDERHVLPGFPWRAAAPAGTMPTIGGVHQAGRVTYDHRIPAAGWRQFPHYALVVIEQGRGAYWQQDAHPSPVGVGRMILIKPGRAHAYRPDPPGWTEVFIVFDGPVFRLWDEHGHLPATPLPPAADPGRAIRRLRRVMDAPDPLAETCRLLQALTELLSLDPAPGTGPRTDPWAQDACARLRDRPRMDRDLRRVARDMGLAYSTFRRKFRRRVGQTPGDFRTRCVIDRACELLAQRDATLQQIADELGFADAFHLSKRFKQITGQPPTAFRHSLLNRR